MIKMHDGAKVLSADLFTGAHDTMAGYVLADTGHGDRWVTWFVEYRDGGFHASTGNYFPESQWAEAVDDYDRRRGACFHLRDEPND
jgi:hypothetical protein